MEVATSGLVDVVATVRDEALQETLEALLSKSNLVRDPFLAGNMNPQMYIPISVLLAHERLTSIDATEEEVIAAAVRSTRLGVDDARKMVRPLLKSKRNVVILRDIPVGTTEADIRQLFVGAPHADLIVSVKPEVNNTWFVKFKLDDGTQDIVLWLRAQYFKGQRVNAAIKSEHFLRSFFPLPMAASVALQHPSVQQGGQGMMQGGMVQGMTMMPGGLGSSVYHLADASSPSPSSPQLMGNSGTAPCWREGEAAEESSCPPGQQQWSGKGMAGDAAVAVLPPVQQMQMGMVQLPGFWQPWGSRHQPAPLAFTSTTALTPASMPVVAQQASPMGPEIFDNLAQSEEGRGRWGKARGRGKNKGSEERSGKGRTPDQTWQPMTTSEIRKHGRVGGTDALAEQGEVGGGAGGAKWVVRGTVQPVLVESNVSVTTSVYTREFRKHTRASFEQICRVMRKEPLTRPESLSLLIDEVPIFREWPSIELADV